MVDTSADGWACQTTGSAADELPRLSKTVDDVRPPQRACDRVALLGRHAFDFIEHLAGAFDRVAVVIPRSTSPDVPPGASRPPAPTSASARISTPAPENEAHREETEDDKPHGSDITSSASASASVTASERDWRRFAPGFALRARAGAHVLGPGVLRSHTVAALLMHRVVHTGPVKPRVVFFRDPCEPRRPSVSRTATAPETPASSSPKTLALPL